MWNKMSAVDDILAYKKDPNDDLYALLNCDEHSTVSNFHFIHSQITINILWSMQYRIDYKNFEKMYKKLMFWIYYCFIHH